MKVCALLLVPVLLAPALVRAEDWSLTRPGGPASRRGEAARRGERERQAEAAPDDQVKARLRARYQQALLAEPTQQLALERLLALYRERDGNLDGLARELEQNAAAHKPGFAHWLLRGQVEAARGGLEAARAAYTEAARLEPRAATPALLRAQLEREHGDPARADGLLQEALPKTTGAQRSEVLRQLAELALDRGDFEAAEHDFTLLAAAGSHGVQELAAYARALAARGLHERAVAAYQQALAALRGDNRVLAPLLVELARAQLEAAEPDAALESLARARALTTTGTGARYEIDELRVDIHRRGGRLPELATQLAAERGGGFAQSELLGRIYDELGDHAQALAALRKALSYEPRSVAARERVIRILSQQGELEGAIREYRALIASAPREPRFVIELAKLLMESGKRSEGLRLLDDTGRRYPRDARLQRSLFELYARVSESARATAVLTQLSRIEPGDPSHLVALGEQLLEHGDQAGALAVWRKLLETLPDKARAHAVLAGTYLDHDMPERALGEYESALKLAPDELDYVRGRAETLEKLQKSGEAAEAWQRVLTLTQDRAQKREARRRIARLWGSSGELIQRIAELERAFAGSGGTGGGARAPDIEAGRFLAECFRALASGRRRGQGDARYLERAEKVLMRVLELDPGDSESMLALERLRSLRGNLAGAIEVLQRLLEADPKNAATYLARMAEHALALYRDADAVAYAERLVALNPNDAKAHERLGDLYRSGQSIESAIASYERAIALDENAFAVLMQLAELYVSRGETGRAGLMLLRVVRASPDDELVKRAARSAMQLGLAPERLRSLEQTLLPLAIGNPQRTVYRALLVELYDLLARPWAEAAREASAAGSAARAELHALAQRAIQPLLSALADPDPAQQRIAIELLGQLHSEHAAAALLSAAERDGDTALRRRALLAAGAAAPPALAARLSALASAPERRLRDAAAFGLARMSGPAAIAALRALRANNTPAVRGYALLGLGRLRDAASFESFKEALRADRSAFVRATAALALAMARDRSAAPVLASALRTEQGDTAAALALALGVLGDRAQVEPLAEAVFADEPGVRRAALWSLRWLAQQAPASSASFVAPELIEPDERWSLSPLLEAWLALAPPTATAEVLRAFQSELRDAAEAALRGPPAATHVALALLSGVDPLLAANDAAAVTPLLGTLRIALDELVKHPDPSVRAAAIVLLASATPQPSAAAVLAALEDGDEQVKVAALDQIWRGGAAPPPDALARVGSIALHDEHWWLRLRAVVALGRAGGEQAAASVLPEVLQHDSYAYVREAAAAALAAIRAGNSAQALAAALVRDPEPRVRAAAARALQQLGGAEAERALRLMDAKTRELLQPGEQRN